MSDPNAPSVPPGWYPDVEVPGGQRWWSGSDWTDHRTPPADAPAAPQYAQPQQYAQAQYSQPAQYGQPHYAQPQYAQPQYVQPQQYAPVALPEHAWPYVGQAAPPGVEVPLWAPLYGATMGQAWKRFWRKYVDFSGRASRSEYWYAALWVFILTFGSYIVMTVLFAVLGSVLVTSSDGAAAFGIISGVLGFLWLLAYIAIVLPMIALAVRRLHDAGYAGYYYFMGFIPFVGGILLLVYLVSESKPQGAIYDLPR